MEVGSLPEAECLTFSNHMGSDTLDAFAPLAQYTQRVHGGMTKDTWLKLSSTITNPDGTVWQRVKVKEEDYVPEWAGLMTVKSEDPVVKAQLRAENMRKSRKQELVSKRRELYGNKTPVERSVSPMFGVSEVGLEDGLLHGDGAGA